MRRESGSRKSLDVYIVSIYCEKAYFPSTVEKLNALLEHSREEPGLLDTQ
jgi:hypothetical protein